MSLSISRRECYAKALYVEVVLDMTKGLISSSEDLQSFQSIFEWLLNGVVNEDEFQTLMQQWVNQIINLGTTQKPKSTLTEQEWMKAIAPYSEYQLDVLLGLFVKIQNNELMAAWNVSDQWIKSVEHLFFLLDTENKTLLSVEEILILLIVISSDSEDHQLSHAEHLLKHTFEIMRECNAFTGFITLRRFKEYFHKNCMEKEIIESSVVLIERDVADLNLISKSTNHDCHQLIIPLLWREAVEETKGFFSNGESYDHFSSNVENFLINEALLQKFLINNFSLEKSGAIHLLYAFSKSSYADKTKRNQFEPKTDPLFVIFEKTLSYFADLVHQTVTCFASVEEKHLRNESSSFVHNNSTGTTANASGKSNIVARSPSQLELKENKQPSFYTPTKKLQEVKDLKTIGELNIKLPFDIDKMIRNAEWIDIKPSSIMETAFLPLKNATIRTMRITVDESIKKSLPPSPSVKTNHEPPRKNEQVTDVKEIMHEEGKQDEVQTQPIVNITTVTNVHTTLSDQEIQDEVDKFISNYTSTPPLQKEQSFSEADTIHFHHLLKQKANLRSFNLGSPIEKDHSMPEVKIDGKTEHTSETTTILSTNIPSNPNNISSLEFLSQPKEYEPDVIFMSAEDASILSPIPVATVPKKSKTGKSASGSFGSPKPSPRIISSNTPGSSSQSQLNTTPRESLSVILTSALQDTSKILKNDLDYSPSKTISVKLSDFISTTERISSKGVTRSDKKPSFAKKPSTLSPKPILISKHSSKPKIVEDTLTTSKPVLPSQQKTSIRKSSKITTRR
ncbi:hypothetical protein C9374_001613 [Naegleria lovaniensis]|uniref:EF-hand domain-containing protein n=1 Tax=Naegleria lovaniensis TaxID=51637 RepID=A0AA88KN75_NAELO|nr:uncharacterized protein C9374_001613 [Naegleria lovaniensis]KAG2387281.1 hypothetical protein C9374_001613 [Naegleria lovaniensis]